MKKIHVKGENLSSYVSNKANWSRLFTIRGRMKLRVYNMVNSK